MHAKVFAHRQATGDGPVYPNQRYSEPELESSNPLVRTRPKTCFIQVSVLDFF
jgi:hypothetical protein